MPKFRTAMLLTRPKSSSGVCCSASCNLSTVASLSGKLLLLVFVLTVLQSSGISKSSLLGADSSSSSGILLAAATESIDCSNLDILKPPRFGKRDAYIDRYRASNKCINSKRFLTEFKMEPMNGGVPPALLPLIFRDPAFIEYWRKVLGNAEESALPNALNGDQMKLRRNTLEAYAAIAAQRMTPNVVKAYLDSAGKSK